MRTRACVSSGRDGGKKWTLRERADWGRMTGSLGTETVGLVLTSVSCLAGFPNKFKRKRERKLLSLLLERYTNLGDQVTSMGILVGFRLWVLPNEIFARWISDGGLRVVLRVESRWVESKAERDKEGLACFFLSAL